jgi:acetyl-CoA synthetase
MGRPLPGYVVQIVDADGNPAREGEVSLALGAVRPAGLMQAYQNANGTLTPTDGVMYHTGDTAFIDQDGYVTFVGRSDDVFKWSDYRISPFELESVLIEHAAVSEAAVVLAPDDLPTHPCASSPFQTHSADRDCSRAATDRLRQDQTWAIETP